jgi:AcrR family transcriptional regulator
LILVENSVLVKVYCSDNVEDVSAPLQARARIRAELTREIIEAARAELVSGGPAGLSLRAVARRLGMVPSALYRYFPNRDALLTALIIDAYTEVGRAAEAADSEAGPDPGRRWRAITTAVRRWAHAHPQEWALVYGSPVPGYRAPQDTVDASLVVTRVIAGVIAAAFPAGSPPPAWLPPAPRGMARVLQPVEAALLPGRPPALAAGALVAWTQVIGMVSLELFGHFVGATTDFDLAYDYAMRIVGEVVGVGR